MLIKFTIDKNSVAPFELRIDSELSEDEYEYKVSYHYITHNLMCVGTNNRKESQRKLSIP